MFDVIVVGTDGSDTAEEATKAAIELAGQHEATLHVVSSYKPKGAAHAQGGGGEHWDVKPRDGVDAILDAAAARARRQDVSVEVHASKQDPAKAILDVAASVDADLIVVGNRGMQGAKRLLLGSVPNSIAHGAGCHVLVLKTT